MIELTRTTIPFAKTTSHGFSRKQGDVAMLAAVYVLCVHIHDNQGAVSTLESATAH